MQEVMAVIGSIYAVMVFFRVLYVSMAFRGLRDSVRGSLQTYGMDVKFGFGLFLTEVVIPAGLSAPLAFYREGFFFFLPLNQEDIEDLSSQVVEEILEFHTT